MKILRLFGKRTIRNSERKQGNGAYRRGVVSEENGQSGWVTGATESASVVFRFANVSIRGH